MSLKASFGTILNGTAEHHAAIRNHRKSEWFFLFAPKLWLGF